MAPAANPFSPTGEKVPEGRMRGGRASGPGRTCPHPPSPPLSCLHGPLLLARTHDGSGGADAGTYGLRLNPLHRVADGPPELPKRYLNTDFPSRRIVCNARKTSGAERVRRYRCATSVAAISNQWRPRLHQCVRLPLIRSCDSTDPAKALISGLESFSPRRAFDAIDDTRSPDCLFGGFFIVHSKLPIRWAGSGPHPCGAKAPFGLIRIAL